MNGDPTTPQNQKPAQPQVSNPDKLEARNWLYNQLKDHPPIYGTKVTVPPIDWD
jgi:hypothetical protein